MYYNLIFLVLKREDITKEKKIDDLTFELESERKNAKLAQEKLALDYAERSKEIETSLQERQQEIQLLQKELRNVKEFRRNKVCRDFI